MLYDLADGPPEPGSLLESIFLLVSLRRREAELFQTEAIIAAVVGTAAKNFEAIEQCLRSYKNSMFPFLEVEKVKKEDVAKAALKQWTEVGPLIVKPLGMPSSESRKINSQLKKQAARNQASEELRKSVKHTRI